MITIQKTIETTKTDITFKKYFGGVGEFG